MFKAMLEGSSALPAATGYVTDEGLEAGERVSENRGERPMSIPDNVAIDVYARFKRTRLHVRRRRLVGRAPGLGWPLSWAVPPPPCVPPVTAVTSAKWLGSPWVLDPQPQLSPPHPQPWRGLHTIFTLLPSTLLKMLTP